MNPELPYLAAGAVAIIGGAIKNKGWPPNMTKSILGTTVLVLAASATSDSAIAPLVHAIGILLLLASILSATNAVIQNKKGA